jgi:hypothetical protein
MSTRRDGFSIRFVAEYLRGRRGATAAGKADRHEPIVALTRAVRRTQEKATRTVP